VHTDTGKWQQAIRKL